MPIFFSVNYDMVGVLARRAGVSKRLQNEAIRFAMFQTARFWARHFLPLHFDRKARHRYRYQRRKRMYQELKQIMAAKGSIVDPRTGKQERADVKKSGMVDIVYGGSTEKKAEGNQGINVTTKGFTIKLRVPRYVVQRRRGSYPNMKREIAQSSVEEARKLRLVFWANYRRFIRRNRVNQTVRI